MIVSPGNDSRPVIVNDFADDHATRFISGMSGDLDQVRIIPKGLCLGEVDPMLLLVESFFSGRIQISWYKYYTDQA